MTRGQWDPERRFEDIELWEAPDQSPQNFDFYPYSHLILEDPKF